jgi:hypothetical protein
VIWPSAKPISSGLLVPLRAVVSGDASVFADLMGCPIFQDVGDFGPSTSGEVEVMIRSGQGALDLGRRESVLVLGDLV